MKNLTANVVRKLTLIAFASCYLSACVGTVVGAVVDTAVEVVKVPFKVGGAVIDAVTSDEFGDNLRSAEQQGESDIDSDAAAVEMESEVF